MSAAAGEDILRWLDGAITTAERDATCSANEFVYFDVDDPEIATHYQMSGSPEAVLRRCAADRKLLELHAPQDSGSGLSEQCRTCAQRPEGDWYYYLLYYPCPTVVALAEGYGWTGGER